VATLLVGNGVANVNLSGDGKLSAWQSERWLKTTGADGRFSFAPELGMESIIVSGAQGFNWVSLSEIAADSNIVLQPWGQISGKLLRPSGPGQNEDLDTQLTAPPGVPPHSYFLGGHCVTDSEGKFSFDHVPPG
jgi:hypothetical protein